MIWKTWTNGQKYNVEEFNRLNANYRLLSNKVLELYQDKVIIEPINYAYSDIPWRMSVQQMQIDLVNLNTKGWSIVDKTINYLNADTINYWEDKGKMLESALIAFETKIKYSGYAVCGVEELWQI